MATIKIGKVETLFTNTPHTATSYQIYNCDNGQIIGQSIRNTTQLLQWSNELSDGNGGHYLHLHNLRARIQLHYGLDDSEWIELDPYDEDIQIAYKDNIAMAFKDNYNVNRTLHENANYCARKFIEQLIK